MSKEIKQQLPIEYLPFPAGNEKKNGGYIGRDKWSWHIASEVLVSAANGDDDNSNSLCPVCLQI